MKKVLVLLLASCFVALIVSLISAAWLSIPVLLVSSEEMRNIMGQIPSFMFFSAVVTLAIVLVLGLPTYLLLDYFGRVTWVNLACAGFAIPIFILFTITFGFSSDENSVYSTGQNYYGTYREMVVENNRTFWGWVSLVEEFITYGVYGLIGATTFGKSVSVLSKLKFLTKQ